MVFRTAFHMVSSHRTRDLECFADGRNTPWNSPTIFIQTWLQQDRRCHFLNSAHCSLSNPISSRSVRCWRTMIQGEFFTRFAKFQRIVSLNGLRFPRRLQELLQALFCVSWEVFVLHGHCVAKSCTTTACRWLFRDSHPSLRRTLWSAVTKTPTFSALGTTVPMRLMQEDLVIFVLKQISQFRSFGSD